VRLWREACEAAGVDYVPVYRATKHSGLTALSELGLSLDDVRAMGRHTSADTTRLYIREDDAKRRRGVEALRAAYRDSESE
jgi:integrase